MIERRRLTHRPKRRRRRAKPRPLFAPLTRVLLRHPPIKHRNDADTRLVSPLEFAIAAGLNALARCDLAGQFHRRALKAGARAIEREKETGSVTKKNAEWTREKPTPPPKFICDLVGITNIRVDKKGDSHWTTDRRKAFKQAGAGGYQRSKEKIRKEELPESITLEVSRAHLLRVAGLPANGTNLSKVQAALKRLRRPVGGMPPLVVRWEQLPSGRLRLVVSTAWTQKPFGRVPLPLPTVRSPAAMSLYLLLFTLNTILAGPTDRCLRKQRVPVSGF
jgi:hypothetical protein